MLDVELFGLAPGPHHLVSAFLHAANAALLLAVLAALTGAAGRSALVAALFAAHPLHVESVAWASERKDVLSALLFLLTLAAYLRHLRRPSPARFLVVAALFALGLLAKPMLVTAPFVLLLLDWWPLGRAGPAAGPAGLRRPAVEKLPLLLLAAASSVVTYRAQEAGRSLATLEHVTLPLRLANAAVSLVAYLGDTLWPSGLAFYYPYAAPRAAATAGAVLALLAISAVAVLLRRRHPALLAGWLWYAGMLVPVIGLVQVGEQSRADRYTYLPLVGIFAAAAWLATAAASRLRLPRGAPWIAAAALLLPLAAATRAQIAHWRDGETLFRRALAVTRGNYIAHNNLGNLLLRREDVPAAMEQLRAALHARPSHATALVNYAVALSRSGDDRGAVAALRRALEIAPYLAEAHHNLAYLLERAGDLDGALRHYREAVALRADLPAPRLNLALLLARRGEHAETEALLREAIRLQPGHAGAHNELGIALARRGRIAEAAAAFAEALRLDPSLKEARGNLERARSQLRRSRGRPPGDGPGN